MRQRLYPESKYPQGHPHLAHNLNNLGALLNAQGKYGEARKFFEQALADTDQAFFVAPDESTERFDVAFSHPFQDLPVRVGLLTLHRQPPPRVSRAPLAIAKLYSCSASSTCRSSSAEAKRCSGGGERHRRMI